LKLCLEPRGRRQLQDILYRLRPLGVGESDRAKVFGLVGQVDGLCGLSDLSGLPSPSAGRLGGADGSGGAPDLGGTRREERRPGSKYAALETCRYEVREAEAMMQREDIPMLDTSSKSIEEIAATILHRAKLARHIY